MTRAILQALEKRALRLQRDAVDLVEQDHFGRRQRPELGLERAGRRVDHLEADDFGRLQIGAALQPRELGVADGREDDAEERLADAGHAAQQEVAGVDLPLFGFVVGGRNLGEQDDVGDGLGGVVADQRLAALGEDRRGESRWLPEGRAALMRKHTLRTAADARPWRASREGTEARSGKATTKTADASETKAQRRFRRFAQM